MHAVHDAHPDLTILSGDFVEHATRAEFEAARAFLTRLPQPQLVVPGNHDLPFYSPVRRYLEGLNHYRRYIADNCNPLFEDDEVVVTGIATPRKHLLKGGRISAAQLEVLGTRMCSLPNGIARVLVTHHPLDLPLRFHTRHLARRSEQAIASLSPCLDLMLAGHLHLSSTGATAIRYGPSGRSVVFAQAGTATSRRNKGEPNSFNSIQIDAANIAIRHHTWNDANLSYMPGPWQNFLRTKVGI